jgi:hypothetical protein
VLDTAASVSPGGLPGLDLARPAAGPVGAEAGPDTEEAVGIGQPLDHGPARGTVSVLGIHGAAGRGGPPAGTRGSGPAVRAPPGLRCHPRGPGRHGGGVVLSQVLDRQRAPAGELAVPLAALNRHALVCGATGAGKSQTIRHLLEQATAAGVPWLVIEPAKAEYRLMAARLPGTEVIAIRPGEPAGIPAGISPLQPAAGPDGTRFPVQAHADLVRALFLAAFEAEEPFPQVLAAALTRCYEQAGWDLALGEPATPGVTRRGRACGTCSRPRPPWSRRSGTGGRSPTTSAASSPSGCPACGSGPRAGSSRAPRAGLRGAYHGRRAQYAIRERVPRASHPVHDDRLAVYALGPGAGQPCLA